jgi:hypothetical protein
MTGALGSSQQFDNIQFLPKFLQNSPKDSDTFISSTQAERLDKAHELAEKLYLCFNLTCITKNHSVYASFKPVRDSFVDKIVTIVSSIHEEPRGSLCMKECVDSGWYLTVLRIYFFYKPEALKNYASDLQMAEPFQSTILHCAVNPAKAPVSFSFVSFVLSMDKKHHLNLSTYKNCGGKNPFEQLEYASYSAQPAKRKELDTVKEMLIQHNTSLSAPSAPPLGAVNPDLDGFEFMERRPLNVEPNSTSPNHQNRMDGFTFTPSLTLEQLEEFLSSNNTTNSMEIAGNEPYTPNTPFDEIGKPDELLAEVLQDQNERDPIITSPPATDSNCFSNLISYVYDSFSALLSWLRSFF